MTEQPPILQQGERLDRINDDLQLIQRENGLTFGTDAYLLSAFCRTQPKGRAADLGCGTGVISLLLAARGKFARIYAVEAQEQFAALAKRNADLNGFSDTVPVLFRDVRELRAADFGGELDVIVSNPPICVRIAAMPARTGKSRSPATRLWETCLISPPPRHAAYALADRSIPYIAPTVWKRCSLR